MLRKEVACIFHEAFIKTTTGIDEKKITSLSNDIEKIEKDKVELVVEYLEHRVERIVHDSVLYAPS